MKTLIQILCLTFSLNAFSQVFNGTQEIEKVNREGAYILSTIEPKFTERVWKHYLNKSGKAMESKGGYTMANAKIDAISEEPITLYSKITKQKDRTQIFASALLANGDIVTNGHEKWTGLSKYLNDFTTVLATHEAAFIAENSYNDANENHKKIVKNGDKLNGKIEDNKKEKEKLLKKIEENKLELEKLLTDVENNKKDQSKAIDDIATKKYALDEAIKKKQ